MYVCNKQPGYISPYHQYFHHEVSLHDRRWQHQGSMSCVPTGVYDCCSHGLLFWITVQNLGSFSWKKILIQVNSTWWHSSIIKARQHEKSSQLNHISPCHTAKVRGVFSNAVLSSGSSMQSTALTLAFMVQGCRETP